MKIILALLCCFLTVSCVDTSVARDKSKVVKVMADQIEKQFPEIRHISIKDFIKLKKKHPNLILVDVREKNERDISIIEGAISKEEFTKLKDKIKVSEIPIIAYCTIGARSSRFAQELKRNGMMAFNLKGSVLEWAHQGLEFRKDGKKLKKVHTYSEAWSLLPDSYTPVFK